MHRINVYRVNVSRSILALLCLAAFACGNAPAASTGECGDGVHGDGEFELAVGGLDAAMLCGRAVSDQDPSGAGWVVQLFSGGSQVSIYTEISGRPSPGIYQIAELIEGDQSPVANEYLMLAFFDEATLNMTLSSISGTLTINSSTASQVSGTFDIRAREGTEGTPGFTVTGTFSANNTDH